VLPDYDGDYVQVNCFTTRDAYLNPTAAPGLASAHICAGTRPRPRRDSTVPHGRAGTRRCPTVVRPYGLAASLPPAGAGRYLGTVLRVDDSKIINMTVPPPAGLSPLSTP
jgi:hypothetical protein